jgi:hypothetical protein
MFSIPHRSRMRCPDEFFDQLHIDRAGCGRENTGGMVSTITDENYAISDAIDELVHFPMAHASGLNHAAQLCLRWLTEFNRIYPSRKEVRLP